MLWLSFIIDGISSLQGGHQVAQKLTSTTFPLRSESFCSLPARSLATKSGASAPSVALLAGTAAFLPPLLSRLHPARVKSDSMINVQIIRFINISLFFSCNHIVCQVEQCS